jgi:hypothetical protein
VASNLRLWTDALNVHGWTDRIWAVAVDDAHEARTNPNSLDLGWVMVKTPTLDERAIRQALERGAFYASNGPRFEVLGVLGGAITASSPDAATIRFIDQDMRVLGQGPASGASYRPTGAERWIRVEAVMADGRTAWSQPFWLLPNAPHAAVSATSSGLVLSGQTLPGATVHVSADGQYLGFVAADGVGSFTYATGLDAEAHDFWVMAAAPWPDHLESLPSLLATGGAAPTG